MDQPPKADWSLVLIGMMAGLMIGAIIAQAVGVAKQPKSVPCECETFLKRGGRACCETCRCGRAE